MSLSVVVLQQDPNVAQSLAGGLRPHFRSVHTANSWVDLKNRLAQTRPEVAVVDVEASRFVDVESLHRDSPEMLIVCTHRIPDEEMWMAALEAGAADVCAARDVNAILASILRNAALTQSTAA